MVVYNVDQKPGISFQIVKNSEDQQPSSEVDPAAFEKITALAGLGYKNYCVENINAPCAIEVSYSDSDIYDSGKLTFFITKGGVRDYEWEAILTSTCAPIYGKQNCVRFKKIFNYDYIRHYDNFGNYWNISPESYKTTGTPVIPNFNFKIEYEYNDGYNDSVNDGADLSNKQPTGLYIVDVDRRPINLQDVKILYPGFGYGNNEGIPESIRYFKDIDKISDRLKKQDGSYDSSLSFVKTDTSQCSSNSPCAVRESAYSINQIYDINYNKVNIGKINNWVDPDGDIFYYNTIINKKYAPILMDDYDQCNNIFLGGECWNVSAKIYQEDLYYQVETFPYMPENVNESDLIKSFSETEACAVKDYGGQKNNEGFFWANSCCLTRGTCGPMPGRIGYDRHTRRQEFDLGMGGWTYHYYCDGMYTNYSAGDGPGYWAHDGSEKVKNAGIQIGWETEYNNDTQIRCMPSNVNNWNPGNYFNVNTWSVETR